MEKYDSEEWGRFLIFCFRDYEERGGFRDVEYEADTEGELIAALREANSQQFRYDEISVYDQDERRFLSSSYVDKLVQE